MKYDVFLSYAHEDLAAVKSLVSEIEAEGLSVFWDRHIAVGQQWSSVLEATLLESRAVVVVWSTASVKSTWVKAEATEAMARKKLVPMRLDGATTGFVTWHWCRSPC
jgi:aspartate aminotransferase-like enzyme